MRGRGYLRAHDRRPDPGRRLGAIAPAPAFSLRHFEAQCFDQGPTESCTGHALAMAIYVSLAANGTPLPFVPSPLGIYTLARCIPPGRPVPLTDTGAQLSDAVVAISEWGIHKVGPLVDGRNSDVSTANVNVEPQLLDLEADAAHVVVGCRRIDPTDIATARSLIASWTPIFVGGFVDSSYEGWHVGNVDVDVPNESDPNGGGHATVIVESFDNADGSTSFGDLTSWGAGFGGDAGHVRVSQGWLAAMWDAFAISATLVTS